MKLKKLLPIITLTSAAIVVTPTIIACSDGTTFSLNDCFSISVLGKKNYYLKTKNTVPFDSTKQYTFKVNLSNYNWTGAIADVQTHGVFCVSPDYNPDHYFETIQVRSVEIKIDGVGLVQVDDFEKEKDKSFYIDEGRTIIYRFDWITKTSKLIYKLTTAESGDFYPLFMPSGPQ